MRRLWTPGWLLVHAAAVALSIGFLLLGWWQVQRAAGGNLLSFGYAVEWPVFAGFVIFVWIKEMRRVLQSPVPGADSGGGAPGGDVATGGVATGGVATGGDGTTDRPTAEDHAEQAAANPAADGTAIRVAGGRAADDRAAVASGARANEAARARPSVRRARSGPAYDDSGDEELAAYNRYLAWLNAHPHASPSDYPG